MTPTPSSDDDLLHHGVRHRTWSRDATILCGALLGALVLALPVKLNVQIPVSPIWRFAVQNEYRAIQDTAAQKKFPDQNAVRLFGELTWDPIRLLPSKGSDTVTLELAGRGWYLPSDRNSLGNKIERLEGQIEVSLLVPITKFQFNTPSLVSNDKSAAKQRIRIRYAAGANEAQAFSHSAQLSLGVEFVK